MTDDIDKWRDALRNALEDMVTQFAGRGMVNGKRALTTMGMSSLEHAFEVLGWPDPFFPAWGGCEWRGCPEWATCGSPTPTGYKRLCLPHFAQVNPRIEP